MEEYRKDKYYYFPTSTKNIAFVLDELYVCLGDSCKCYGFKKNHVYKVIGFLQGKISTIYFEDENGKELGITAFDVGSFRSLKEHRKKKLLKLNSL